MNENNQPDTCATAYSRVAPVDIVINWGRDKGVIIPWSYLLQCRVYTLSAFSSLSRKITPGHVTNLEACVYHPSPPNCKLMRMYFLLDQLAYCFITVGYKSWLQQLVKTLHILSTTSHLCRGKLWMIFHCFDMKLPFTLSYWNSSILFTLLHCWQNCMLQQPILQTFSYSF